MNVYFTTEGNFRHAYIEHEDKSIIVTKQDILEVLQSANINPDDNRVLWTF